MSFLKNIFKKEPKLPPINFSDFGADIHSHLIPGIDDGAANIEASITMIKKFATLGFNKIITTPHTMCDYYKNTPEIILSGLEDVRKALKAQNIDIEINAASEYNLDDGLSKLIDDKQVLTMGDNYVLFELPFMSEPPNFQEIVFQFQTNGYKPILAHPERYSYWYDDFEIYDELRAKGILLQLNLLSLTGHYSPQTKKVAEKMVEANLIDAVGTDCHRIEHLYLLEKFATNKYFHQLANQENLFNKKV